LKLLTNISGYIPRKGIQIVEFFDRHRYSNIALPINMLKVPPSWVSLRAIDSEHVERLKKAILQEPSKLDLVVPLLCCSFGKYIFYSGIKN